MATITLKDLAFLNQQLSLPLKERATAANSLYQQQFQLLVRQKRLGLNIDSVLDDRLSVWLEELEGFVPGIFDPRKKIYLSTSWQARLMLEDADYRLEVPINAGVVKDKIRLYEWRIGGAELIWSDRVKLWVACNYLQYLPEKLVIVICAFSSNHDSSLTKIRWNKHDYQAIEKEIKSLLLEDTSTTSSLHKYPDYMFNINEIPEVKL